MSDVPTTPATRSLTEPSPPPDQADDPSLGPIAGQTVGGFVVKSLLGRGGMGSVYRANQLSLNRPVALKILLPEYAVRPGAKERFEREAKVTAALRHPNAIEIYDYGAADGFVYLAMEMLEGQPLRSVVSEELPLLPLARAVFIASKITDVLVAAHAIDLVHRDLKTENVFLHRESDGTERVVVLDFGLGFILGDADIGRKTVEGMITGTPDYLSPEQAHGIAVGTPSDIYSLGCMLYELLSGRVPFMGHPMQVLTKQMYAVPPPPGEANRAAVIPRALSDLVMAMLAKAPADRPTALEVQAGLKGFLGPEKFERARERIGVEGRAARMISTIRPAGTEAPVVDAADAMVVAVIGELEGDLVVALAVNGIVAYIVSDEQPIEGAHAIFAPQLSPVALGALKREHRLPVVTDTLPSDVARLPALLRAGVDEVLPRPVRAEELARRVARAVKKSRAAQRKGT